MSPAICNHGSFHITFAIGNFFFENIFVGIFEQKNMANLLQNDCPIGIAATRPKNIMPLSISATMPLCHYFTMPQSDDLTAITQAMMIYLLTDLR